MNKRMSTAMLIAAFGALAGSDGAMTQVLGEAPKPKFLDGPRTMTEEDYWRLRKAEEKRARRAARIRK